jgi:hypothetical protein
MQPPYRFSAARRSPLFATLLAAFAFPLVACGGSIAPRDAAETVIADSGSDAGSADDAPASTADCATIIDVSPVITVILASPSGAGCAATFTAYDPTTDTAGVPIGATLCTGSAHEDGCPTEIADAASGACVYALDAFALSTPQSVQVSDPGYVPAQIDSVVSGEGGCVGPVPSTHATVTLQQVELSVGGAH